MSYGNTEIPLLRTQRNSFQARGMAYRYAPFAFEGGLTADIIGRQNPLGIPCVKGKKPKLSWA
jgi:hypothetical protein